MLSHRDVLPILSIHGPTGEVNPLEAQFTHMPFPQLARVLRDAAWEITVTWDAECRLAMPQMQRLTFDELKDSTPEILLSIADALASGDPHVINELLHCAPSQGLSRFRLRLGVIEVMQEDRLLRAITVKHVESGLGRQMDEAESAALHATVDLMLQRSVIALVNAQKLELQAAATTELKYLSFLAHDMNNNLNSVSLLLQLFKHEMEAKSGPTEGTASLKLAQQAIHDTIAGMRRMLDHAKMKDTGKRAAVAPVSLRQAAMKVAEQFSREVLAKNMEMVVEALAETVVDSNEELIGIILQNLVGNATKYCESGTIRIGCSEVEGQNVLWVSDEGPGIAPEKMGAIFEAFTRGDVQGQSGVGLGLAIAAEAAKLLGAELTVESVLGKGSTFRLAFPLMEVGRGHWERRMS